MKEAAEPTAPVPFLAAAAALEAIDQAVKDAQRPDAAMPAGNAAPATGSGPHPALAALLMLREVREQLAGWESGLIETARGQGASWADLAGPLGVASRQAAERRYLRLRPGTAGSTGDQRVQATRDTRAADRTVTAWARDNAADLRRLAGQVTSLIGLPASARDAVDDLNGALADNDAARLVRPLAGTRPHLRPEDAELAARIDALTRHADQLRQDSHDQRNT
ncbi:MULTISPECIES: HSP18 transcriptional regulator [unclassified Streptomyces]|uniref:HSP18 transcriptional regulator n=1 Tax=unclassified Streptomyces TaxID=2593676 RepID=UPI0020305A4F|nr:MULTISPECIES: HSP18 transcriptional regulator [unclassified Streptomyces]MCM1974711.1 HSP18 transcriptional regulator [Streptomyces sp. G1]MCX5296997.1 HSP18 transcriptional regulator [Streptomyces sp. NBC_00193]